ncbi:DnaB-like helicase C-terminal domain-containing protein [Thermoactinomyces sp. CICC 10522]|uniref:replicative DNA helicase n=1 Tax=Thermoactinomyces sp. CICC 10522 TaxID=2767427 RepID=UPI0018DB32B4|nr:DnaB-like helicase C-terminal domain-containing protein [Thermoactinomyces sp. CICC 10522]MBH8605589.1 DnaB-like helicase C-terminal domain-containing protein [Thermoactinomyces sp. CICC 10522]
MPKEISEIKASKQEQSNDSNTIQPLDNLLISTFERFEERSKNQRKIQGLESGFVDLDHMLTGSQKSNLIVLASRPSMGKSTLALNIASNVASHKNKTVAYFNLETSKDQLIDRLICSVGNINAQAYHQGILGTEDLEKYSSALEALSGRKLFIDDKPNITVSEIKEKCYKIIKDHGLDLVIIDYLQLIRPKKYIYNNRNEEIDSISRSLKILARELDVPVIVLSQLSRACEQREDKRPVLSDLRDSGAIEQDADVVLFLYCDDYYNKETVKRNIAELIVSKQRQGGTGTIELLFLRPFYKFLSLEIKEQRKKQ